MPYYVDVGAAVNRLALSRHEVANRSTHVVGTLEIGEVSAAAERDQPRVR
jgi:hypothetical protein